MPFNITIPETDVIVTTPELSYLNKISAFLPMELYSSFPERKTKAPDTEIKPLAPPDTALTSEPPLNVTLTPIDSAKKVKAFSGSK